jgi:hypothetical protein
VVHRDFGYLFFGITIVYGVSGIALNHVDDWNPNYVISYEDIEIDQPGMYAKGADKEVILELLEEYDVEHRYKNHYYPRTNQLKVFLKEGSLVMNTESGLGFIEFSKRRRIFAEMNYLHYNPIKYFTYFSDLYAGALIVLAITGLFIVRGKKGITGRGAWLTLIGIIVPLIYLFVYFY